MTSKYLECIENFLETQSQINIQKISNKLFEQKLCKYNLIQVIPNNLYQVRIILNGGVVNFGYWSFYNILDKDSLIEQLINIEYYIIKQLNKNKINFSFFKK